MLCLLRVCLCTYDARPCTNAGALLFALSIELFGTAIAEKAHLNTGEYNKIVLVMAAAALGGGLVFTGLDHVLNDAGAFMRKFSTLHSAQTKGYMGKLLSSRTISALQATHIFRNVPRLGLEQLLPHMDKITFPRNTLAVVSELRDDSPIYFVVSGSVRFACCDEHGTALALGARVISKNQIFGHEALTVGANVRFGIVCQSQHCVCT